MPEVDDSEYYAARAVKAQSLADAAADPMIAAIHREMAANYLKLASLTGSGRPSPHFVDAQTA